MEIPEGRAQCQVRRGGKFEIGVDAVGMRATCVREQLTGQPGDDDDLNVLIVVVVGRQIETQPPIHQLGLHTQFVGVDVLRQERVSLRGRQVETAALEAVSECEIAHDVLAKLAIQGRPIGPGEVFDLLLVHCGAGRGVGGTDDGPRGVLVVTVQYHRFIRIASTQLQFSVGKELRRLLAVHGIGANRLVGEDIQEACRVHRRAGLGTRIVANHVAEVIRADEPGDPAGLLVDQLKFLRLVGSTTGLGDRIERVVGGSGVVVDLHSKQLPPGGDAHELQPVGEILAEVQRRAVLACPQAVGHAHEVVSAGIGGHVIERVDGPRSHLQTRIAQEQIVVRARHHLGRIRGRPQPLRAGAEVLVPAARLSRAAHPRDQIRTKIRAVAADLIVISEGQVRRHTVGDPARQVALAAVGLVVPSRHLPAAGEFVARIGCDDLNDAAGGVPTEQRALGPLENFDPADVVESSKLPVRARHVDAVHIRAHRGLVVQRSVG